MLEQENSILSKNFTKQLALTKNLTSELGQCNSNLEQATQKADRYVSWTLGNISTANSYKEELNTCNLEREFNNYVLLIVFGWILSYLYLKRRDSKVIVFKSNETAWDLTHFKTNYNDSNTPKEEFNMMEEKLKEANRRADKAEREVISSIF